MDKNYTTSKKTLYKTRAGFGVWRWVHVRYCPNCGKETHILGVNSTMRPQLGIGAIRCNNGICSGLINLG